MFYQNTNHKAYFVTIQRTKEQRTLKPNCALFTRIIEVNMNFSSTLGTTLHRKLKTLYLKSFS